MANATKAVRSVLIASTSVSSLVGSRVYYGQLPQNATLPAIVLNVTNSEPIRNLQGLDGLRRTELQADIYAASTGSPYEETDSVSDAVRLSIENAVAGVYGGVTWRKGYANDIADFDDPPNAGEEFSRRGKIVELIVWHGEGRV